MRLLLLLCAATLLSLLCGAQTARDEERVRQVIIAFQEDFNEGSFQQAPSYTTPDWEHIHPFGGRTSGREAVLKEVRAVHQTFLKGVTMRIDTMDIRFPTPEVAIAVVRHSITAYVTPDGVRHEGEQHIKTYVVVWAQGRWRLAHDHNTIVQGNAGRPD